ncbi:hypothetical protein NG701_15485 [Pseudarthrobacter sp. HLT3-5]|uniref:hypothetical protein n=1 Tax=Pseudarthrobacter cellobiosi TaxID=2953654 RepID=UPI00208DF9D8|nr:hypothetical protein [Pseudarthrobacter sp. HLT3-5]MCO4275817.1 hypothetical protein [Pseudarthrobacter sp. HLT3-5]
MVFLHLGPLGMLPAVQLHHQPALQQEINLAHTRKVGLGFHADPGLPEVGPGQGFQERARTPVHPPQDLTRRAVPLSWQPGPQKVHGHFAPLNGTFHHHQGLGKAQAPQRVDEDIGQCGHGPVGLRWQQQAGMVDPVAGDRFGPAVMHMQRARGRQRPQPMEGRGAGTRQELAVTQQAHKL